MNEKKYCISCLENKKEPSVVPNNDGRCPVCNSDSLLSLAAVTSLLGSKTQSPSLSIHEENTLIDEFSIDEERRVASKPVRPNMVLHEVTLVVGKATLRCVRFAVSASEAIKQASLDPAQPWYLHEGKLSEGGVLLASKAIKREKLTRLGS